MVQYPENLFTDIRYETVVKTTIQYENGVLKQNRTQTERGAFIRVFDGKCWYYCSTTDLDALQSEIDALAAMATPNAEIANDPVVQRLAVNTGSHLVFSDDNIAEVTNERKLALVSQYLALFNDYPEIKNSRLTYLDVHTEKHILSSKGTDVLFDSQSGCISMAYTILTNDFPQQGRASVYETRFALLEGQEQKIRDEIEADIHFAKNAVPIEAGTYTCVLSPAAAGVFAHESFGHKSEADFMIGDAEMCREWVIGKQVGAPILNIIDTGQPDGSGYVPFDDEGAAAQKTYLIRDGVLSGRLHSAYTAAALGEAPTANARAINFEFEPIVRMTSTYIDKGTLTKDELFASIRDGIYVEQFIHGSGMSTFTIAPSRAYRIRDGKVAEPVKIAVISGNVMKTLYEIDGLSNEVDLLSFGTGGCGKMEQFPLRVAFGGPYMRVNGLKVQ